jgi:hypothetical protein
MHISYRFGAGRPVAMLVWGQPSIDGSTRQGRCQLSSQSGKCFSPGIIPHSFLARRGIAVLDAPRRLQPLDHRSVVTATNDLNGLGPSEDGQPANDLAVQEVGERGFFDLIAGASQGSWFLAREDDAERRRRHSHAERGNECE